MRERCWPHCQTPSISPESWWILNAHHFYSYFYNTIALGGAGESTKPSFLLCSTSRSWAHCIQQGEHRNQHRKDEAHAVTSQILAHPPESGLKYSSAPAHALSVLIYGLCLVSTTDKQTQTRQVSWCCLIRIVKWTTRSPISGLSVPQAPAKHQLSPKTSLSHHHSCGHLSCPSSSFKNTDDVAFSVYKATSPEACSSSSLGALRQNCHGLLKAGTQIKTAHISFFRVLKEHPCPRGDRYQRGNFLICNSSRKSQTKRINK